MDLCDRAKRESRDPPEPPHHTRGTTVSVASSDGVPVAEGWSPLHHCEEVTARARAAEVIADRAAGAVAAPPSVFGCGVKPIAPDVAAAEAAPRDPIGVRGNYPIAFGGGQQGAGANPMHP